MEERLSYEVFRAPKDDDLLSKQPGKMVFLGRDLPRLLDTLLAVQLPTTDAPGNPWLLASSPRRPKKFKKTFEKYATTALTIMHRAEEYSIQERVDQVYINMDPEIQLHVRYEDMIV